MDESTPSNMVASLHGTSYERESTLETLAQPIVRRKSILRQSKIQRKHHLHHWHSNISSSGGITIISVKDKLPTFACERNYMVGEIQLKAKAFVVLQDDSYNSSGSNNSTCCETVSSSSSNSSSSISGFSSRDTLDSCDDSIWQSGSTHHNTENAFNVLYLVWNTEIDSATVQDYVQDTVRPAVSRVYSDNSQTTGYGTDCDGTEFSVTNSSSSLSPPASPRSVVSITSLPSFTDVSYLSAPLQYRRHDSTTTTQEPSVYVVIDIITTKECDFGKQKELAQQLARCIASNSSLRQSCRGVSVGMHSPKHAASPGLEHVVNSLQIGARDRFMYKQHSRCNKTDCETSWMTLYVTDEMYVVNDPSSSISSHSHHGGDKTRPLEQALVFAEWGSQGTLDCMAQRAHKAWCKHFGVQTNCNNKLSYYCKDNYRKRKRAAKKAASAVATVDENASDQLVKAFLYDKFISTLILLYVAFHTFAYCSRL